MWRLLADNSKQMKHIKKYIGLILTISLLYSCKESNLITYPEESGGNNIYFLEKFDSKASDSLMRPISLGLTPESVKDSLLTIVVQTTGIISDQDRKFRVEANDTSSMVRGVHYDILNDPIIPANETSGNISIILYRTADLLEKRAYLKLELKDNEHFQTGIKTITNVTHIQDLLSFHIYLDDLFPVPYLWTSYSGKTFIINQWGEYSRKKVELMLEVLQANPEIFYDANLIVQPGTVVGYASYMKFWLSREKLEGRIYYDDQGKEILMGKNAK